MSGQLLIGTSGWSYKHWVGPFYPPRLPPARWLGYYRQYFRTVEVNTTFYHLPGREVFEKWSTLVPPGFMFTLKAGRRFSHFQHLEHPEKNLLPLLERASGLGEKFRVLLVQLPTGFGACPERLERLFDFLDRQNICPNLRAALEIRDPACYSPETINLLRQYHGALVMADWPGFTNAGPVTGDLVYLRRHGPGTLYASDYTEEMLQNEARSIRIWLAEGKDVFVYYNNDAGGFAVKNALRLGEILKVELPGRVEQQLGLRLE